MRRFRFVCVAAVLLLTSTVYADLTVHEYVTGEKVVLDSETGNYWYYNLKDFESQTYTQQISTIAGLGTYGNIAGGWHMATYEEMEKLWENEPSAITSSFAPTATLETEHWFMGRYNQAWSYVNVGGETVYCHRLGKAKLYIETQTSELGQLELTSYADASFSFGTGAWVTTDASVVPVPGAALLAVAGLLSSIPGVRRLRRKL